MAINNIPNLFQPRVSGFNSTPNLFNIDQAQVQQAIDQKKINDGLVEQERRKRADQSMKLQQFADTMRMVNANKSGNYGASKIFSDRIAQRKLLAEQKQKEALLKTQQDEFVKNNPQYRNAIQLNTLFPGLKLPTAKDRRIVEGVDKRKYYEDGTLVLPNVKPKVENRFEIKTTDVIGAQKDERKTFEAANKGVKNFQQLLDAAQSADGAASYALMIKFIKQLDDSVVREGEVATFGGFQGALENFKLYVQKAKGEGFTPTVKANMINLATQTANRLVEDYNTYKAGKTISYDAIGFEPNMIFAGLDFNLKDLDLTKEYTSADFEFIEFE
jgi:hypothetical protein